MEVPQPLLKVLRLVKMLVVFSGIRMAIGGSFKL
jgi:hypothetical protein